MSSARSVLLFGANGQLGRRLSVALTEQGYEVTALDRAACDFATVDAKKIEVLMRAVEPALVIIAAAYTEVDRAESQPELAARINGEVPGWIAQAARAHGAPCIHFSTDYVFDGARGPYRNRCRLGNAPQRGRPRGADLCRVGVSGPDCRLLVRTLCASGHLARGQCAHQHPHCSVDANPRRA